jgi:hypothetical protein
MVELHHRATGLQPCGGLQRLQGRIMLPKAGQRIAQIAPGCSVQRLKIQRAAVTFGCRRQVPHSCERDAQI